MSKSVLVIDTPENCGKCKFISEFWCRAMGGRRVPNNDVIPDWCPLKPLPEKRDTKMTGADWIVDIMTANRSECMRKCNICGQWVITEYKPEVKDMDEKILNGEIV